MASKNLVSNLKVIASGNTPTTSQLANGEFAFGIVDGVARLFGNVGGTIYEFSLVRSVAGKTGNVTLAKGDVGLTNVDNVRQYSVNNPPPYPVKSVNGKTGAVTLSAADVKAATVEQGEKADTAYQKPSTGIPKSDLDTAVQEVLTTADAEPALRQAADTALGGRIDDILDGTTPVHDWATEDDIFELAPTSFGETSWSKISALSTEGRAGEFFNVGDEKTIQLTTGEDVTLVILGFNHDDLTGGGKAGITIGMKNLLATTYKMNSSNTNAGGWNGSAMRTSTMATLLSQLPADLRNVIKQVNKKATAGSQSTTITTSADKLFLFALAELASKTGLENSTGTSIKNNAATYEQEGTQYEYFKNTVGDADIYKACPALVKKLSNGGGSARYWWLRSPALGGSTYFWYVRPSGGVSINFGASYSYGVSFGFCV